MLSQSGPFQWKGSSLKTVVEDGRLEDQWLRIYLAQQAPHSGLRVLALDGSPWPRPRTRTLEDPYWGKVRLERWNHLHEKKGADVPYDVVCARVHLEREKPPAAQSYDYCGAPDVTLVSSVSRYW